jgi:branched-chain amino acid transport system substrate-binding protein
MMRHGRVVGGFVVSAAACLTLSLVGTGVTSAQSGTGGEQRASSHPVLVGADLSLTGDFATTGVPYSQGYKLWAKNVNAHGGLLGRKVDLTILSDASTQAQVTTNYEKLISIDHATLLFGPVSTLFTVPAAKEALRFGYSLVEGAGGGPIVFSSGLTNVFDTGQPVADAVVPYAKYLASLPKSIRPKTAAYATENTPFDVPETDGAQQVLQAAGVRTVYDKTFPTEEADYTAIADQIAETHATAVILGAGDLSVLSPFIHAFVQEGYNPKALYSANAVSPPTLPGPIGGMQNVNGIATTAGWWPGFSNSTSKAFVSSYLKTYGGTATTIAPGVAEGYSVGEVVQAAVEATHSTNNAKIIRWLHSGKTIQTVLGPVTFNAKGENTTATGFIFQWVNDHYTAVIPRQPGGPALLYPKPKWGRG